MSLALAGLANSGAGHHAEVPLGVTLFFAGLLVAMVLSLALEEKLHAKKSVIVGLFAVVALFAGTSLRLLPIGEVINVFGEHISLPVYIPAIDWGVIAIILGSSLFVDVTSRSGLFTWIAIKLTKASSGDPVRLLWFYGVMTVVFSAVLNKVRQVIGAALVVDGGMSAGNKTFRIRQDPVVLEGAPNRPTLFAKQARAIVPKDVSVFAGNLEL